MTATIITPVDLAIPARPCATWCTAGPHDDWHPNDRACSSDFQEVPLTQHPVVQMTDKEWQLDNLDVYLRREPRSESTLVVLNHEGKDSVTLTLEEAVQLHLALEVMVGAARRAAR